MIHVEHLTKRFARVTAVDDISLDVSQGEIVGLLGPNGAGKSTIMRILTGFLSPTRGKVLINGLDVTRHSLKTKKLIGYLPENNPLYEDMRVSEYLRYRAGLYRVESSKLKSSLALALERCRLTDVSGRIIGTLSKGYRQRVGLASALVGNPRILILDEPTIGLDPNQIIEVRKLIRELASEHTILLSSHILSEIEMLAQRVLILNRGKIVANDATKLLGDGTWGKRKITLEIKGDRLDHLKQMLSAIPGVLEVNHQTAQDGFERFVISTVLDKDLRTDIFKTFKDGPYDIRELSLEKRTLEDVFVAITTGAAVELSEEKVS